MGVGLGPSSGPAPSRAFFRVPRRPEGKVPASPPLRQSLVEQPSGRPAARSRAPGAPARRAWGSGRGAPCGKMRKPDGKIVLLGDMNVGKTSLLQRYMERRFPDTVSTVGGAFYLKQWRSFNISIWDTAGEGGASRGEKRPPGQGLLEQGPPGRASAAPHRVPPLLCR